MHSRALPLCACPLRLQAASFRLSTEKIFTPLVTLSILINQNPQLAPLRKSFPSIAQQLLDDVRAPKHPYPHPHTSCTHTTPLAHAVVLQQCAWHGMPCCGAAVRWWQDV